MLSVVSRQAVLAAGIPPRCQLAHAIAPVSNNVVGQLEGLALYVGPALAVALVAVLVLMSAHKIRGRLAASVAFILGGLLALTIIGGVFGSIVHNPC